MTDDCKPGAIFNADGLPTYREMLARILKKGGQLTRYVPSHKESHIQRGLPSSYPAGIQIARHVYAAVFLLEGRQLDRRGPVSNFDIGIYCSLKNTDPLPLRRFHLAGFISPLSNGGDIVGAYWAGGAHSKAAERFMVRVSGTTTPVVLRPPAGPPELCYPYMHANYDATPAPLLLPSAIDDESVLCRRCAWHVQKDLDKLSGHKGFIAWPARRPNWRQPPFVAVYCGTTYVASAEVGDIKSMVQAREYLKSCALNHITFKGAL